MRRPTLPKGWTEGCHRSESPIQTVTHRPQSRTPTWSFNFALAPYLARVLFDVPFYQTPPTSGCCFPFFNIPTLQRVPCPSELQAVLVKNSIAAEIARFRFEVNPLSPVQIRTLGSLVTFQFGNPQNISFVWPRHPRSSCLSFVAMMQSSKNRNADNLSALLQSVICVTGVWSSSSERLM